jgi:hypothetical protein
VAYLFIRVSAPIFRFLNGALGPTGCTYQAEGLTARCPILFILKRYLVRSDSGGREEEIFYFRYGAGAQSRNTSSRCATASHSRLHLPPRFTLRNPTDHSRILRTLGLNRCQPSSYVVPEYPQNALEKLRPTTDSLQLAQPLELDYRSA